MRIWPGAFRIRLPLCCAVCRRAAVVEALPEFNGDTQRLPVGLRRGAATARAVHVVPDGGTSARPTSRNSCSANPQTRSKARMRHFPRVTFGLVMLMLVGAPSVEAD